MARTIATNREIRGSGEIATGRAIAVGRELAGINYLLGPFTFSNNEAAPMASPHTESGAVGALVLTQTDGQFSSSGGKMNFPAQSSPTWGDQGWLLAEADGTPKAFSRVVGRALLTAFNFTLADRNMMYGWNSSAVVPNPNVDVGVNLRGGSAGLHYRQGAAGDHIATLSDATEYQIGIILRSAGAFLVIKGGAFSEWALLYVLDLGSAGTLYGAYSNYDASGTLDNVRAYDLPAPWPTDYGIALNRSTFTAANGTNLTALTPEIGGVWTARNGTFDVQSNRANATGSAPGSPYWIATVDAGTADVVIEATVRFPSASIGLDVRYADNNNLWRITLNAGTAFQLYERNAGTWTLRASAAVSIAANTDHRVVAICDGSTITALLNNGSRISYSSATLNQSATTHGFFTDVASGAVDHFAIYPRTLSGAALAALSGV